MPRVSRQRPEAKIATLEAEQHALPKAGVVPACLGPAWKPAWGKSERGMSPERQLVLPWGLPGLSQEPRLWSEQEREGWSP